MTIRTFLIILLTAVVWVSPAVAETEPLKTVVNPKHLADTTQFGYSQVAIVSPKAKVIYVAGQIGVSEDGPNDFESQVDRSFDNLIAVVEAAGGRIEDVVKITLFIKNHDERKLQYLVNKRRDVFGDRPPASTLIPVSTLALESLEFEIDAIVVTPNQ
jgi:enamine deaminase RidA (YjgF/YER057c/UK114 family)